MKRKPSDGDYARLADFVRSHRKRTGLSQREFAAAAGIAYATLQSVERGVSRSRLPDTMPLIERALGWEPGSARRIVEEQGAPILAEADEPSPDLTDAQKLAAIADLFASSMNPAARDLAVRSILARPSGGVDRE